MLYLPSNTTVGDFKIMLHRFASQPKLISADTF